MTAARFDELIHPTTRLSLVALLAAADWAEFAFLRDQLDLSDSALSKQLSTLEEAGYVQIDRPLRDRRRRGLAVQLDLVIDRDRRIGRHDVQALALRDEAREVRDPGGRERLQVAVGHRSGP